MTQFTEMLVFFSLLLLFFSGVKHYSKSSILPPEAWLLIFGIVYGLLKKYAGLAFLPVIDLKPEVILFFFLPLLIFASGRHVNVKSMRKHGGAIAMFAAPGVVGTALIIGYPLAWVLGIDPIHGMMFGAAIAATDPIAVSAIFSRFSLPQDLDMLVEGESMFNDGTTVVLFTLLFGIAINGAEFDIAASIASFAWAVLAAIPIGFIAGWSGAMILERWHETQVFFLASMGIIISLLTFYLAEHILHVSGVIAVLMAALIFAYKRYHSKDAKKDKTQFVVEDAFWDYLSQTLNGFMFFMLGLATGLHPFDLPWPALVVGLMMLLFARAFVIYAGSGILRLFGEKLKASWQHVLALGGLRGAVSAALILMIPTDYPYREYFLCLAFLLIACSLIFQPLAMHAYLRRAKL